MNCTIWSRRKFIAAAGGALAAAGMGCVTVPRSHRPPNVLFIYTDDQGPWALGAAGNPDAHTPHLDRFFAEGVRLENSFVTTPVCSPSRLGLLVSRYGTEVGITDWISPTGGPNRRDESELGLDPALPSWVSVFADAGYATGLVGKWHLGTQDRYHPSLFGYHEFAGFRPGGTRVDNPELEVGGESTAFEGLTVDVLTDLALDFMRRHEARPFCLSLHYRAPHAPWLPVAEEDWAPYEGRALTLPNPSGPELDTDRIEHQMREYLASVTGVDRNVGRLLAYLDTAGLADNTIVVFTSDNGYCIGHHGILHKGNGYRVTRDVAELPRMDDRVLRPNMFEASLRVPTAVRWPAGLTGGRSVERTFTNLDWYPTLLAMARLQPPPHALIRGHNALPLLRGESVPWNDTFYGEYRMHHYTEADLRMFRTPEWKLVRDFHREGHDELYHLAADPGETQNRIDDPSASDARASLEAALADHMRAIDNAGLANQRK